MTGARWLLVSLCLFHAAHAASSEDPPDTPPPASNSSAPSDVLGEKPERGFGRQLLYDTRYILTAPTRWEKDDWQLVGLATAGVLGLSALADKPERDRASDRRNTADRLASAVEPFGSQYSAYALAGFYAGGKLFDSPRAVAVAEDGVTASIIASGMIAPLIKWSVGRVRPSQTEDRTKFRPFGGGQSFPSGHTTQAFALASVISTHYDSVWVDSAAYATAALVGYARHQHEAHWPTDIVVGAIIGFTVGRTVVKLNDDNRGARVSVMQTERGPMLTLTLTMH